MMHADFWHDKWKRGELGFHQDDINPFLKKYWGLSGAGRRTPVFVPLCGKSLDMTWLSGRGCEVWGVEISDTAIRDFFAGLGLEPSIRRDGKHMLWEAQDYHLWCGDLFDLDDGQLSLFRHVYDRASMIALPGGERRRYCAHLRSRMPALEAMLLVTLEYPEGEMDGPPFSVGEDEVRAAFGDAFEVRVLEVEDRLAESPHLQQKGLSRLLEKAYLISA